MNLKNLQRSFSIKLLLLARNSLKEVWILQMHLLSWHGSKHCFPSSVSWSNQHLDTSHQFLYLLPTCLRVQSLPLPSLSGAVVCTLEIFLIFQFKFSKLLHSNSKFACNNLVGKSVEIALCVNARQYKSTNFQNFLPK